jgi:hypothetical protein
MMVSLVPPEHVHECWPHVQGFMTAAAEYTYGRFHEEDIYDLVSQRQDHHLWIAFEEGPVYRGAVVTSFTEYPGKRVLAMQFCGGEQISEWKGPMLALLRRWAKDTKCDAIEFTGRKGWVKLFANDGSRVHWVTCELPLGAKIG